MKSLVIITITIILFFAGCDRITDFDPADEITSIPVLEGFMSTGYFQMLRENRHAKVRVPVDIAYDGKSYEAHIENQGAGSRYHPKRSYEIILGDGKTILGQNHFNLSAQVGDPSMIITEAVTYLYKEAGFPVFYSHPVFFKINGENEGLYSLVERIDLNFFNKRELFLYELIKVRFGSVFTFKKPNNLSETFEKEYKYNNDLCEFAEFIHALDTINSRRIFPELEKFLDVDNYLKYHALTTILSGTDGFANNFYFYKTTLSSPYKILPWDFDRSFDRNFKDALYGKNEIIDKLLKNDSSFTIYKNHLTHFVNDVFTEVNLFPIIDETAANIREGYYLDAYLGLNGYNLDEEVQKLKDFITNRRNEIISALPDFHYAP